MLTPAEVEEVFRRFAERAPRRTVRPSKVKRSPFRSLVSVMLSAQSPDARTAIATRQLFAEAATPQDILSLPEGRLEQLIAPAGLYNTKARNLRAMCRDLLDRFDGQVPSERTALMSLPGVGRKSADILLRFVHGEAVIPVDTHVHRVCNRLGLARGKTEQQTAISLEARVPQRYLMDGHIWLIEHGRRICRARRPRCAECFLADLCETVRSAMS